MVTHAPDCNLSPYHSRTCGRQCGDWLAKSLAAASWAAVNETCRLRATVEFRGTRYCRQHAIRAGYLDGAREKS
jgi:hypothetical protein